MECSKLTAKLYTFIPHFLMKYFYTTLLHNMDMHQKMLLQLAVYKLDKRHRNVNSQKTNL